jgi:phospholipid/cholesterol/gamma-HCH transport system permease protein
LIDAADSTSAEARVPPGFRQQPGADGTPELVLSGDWVLATLKSQFPTLEARLTPLSQDAALRWDLTHARTVDHAGALLLWRAWGGKRPALLRVAPDQAALIDHVAQIPVYARHGRRRWFRAALPVPGRAVVSVLGEMRDGVAMIGQLVFDLGYLVAHPSHIPWREISANIYRTGARALGITALVGFLIGVVLSYLSGKQLRLYGADVFIVNILGMSIIRELGPMLAAILIAGRSGSSMTAQLGVMRVTQELDALSVMGISHTLRLVLPKVIALSLSMPLIVLWTSAMALVGGIVASEIQLDIGYALFLERLPKAVPIANLWLGLAKGVVFGALIAIIACHFGLRVKPNTESLGAGTTTSVVVSITTVIIVDAIFAISFSNVGIVF